MYARLDVISQRLEWLGLTHRSQPRKMLHRIAGPATSEEFAALVTLADVLEPVKDYTRGESTSYQAITTTPLNHMVDAVPPESDAGRRFGELVDKFISTSCLDGDTRERLRVQLTSWRDNDTKLQPLAQRSFLVKEVAANSQDLSALGNAGLAALDAIVKGQPAPEAWKAQQLGIIEQVKKPKAQLLLIPAPAIQKLIEAAAAAGSCATPTP
jgi:hexosaminidase